MHNHKISLNFPHFLPKSSLIFFEICMIIYVNFQTLEIFKLKACFLFLEFFFRGRRRCVSRYFSNREVKRDDKLMSIEMNLLKHETRKKLRLFPSQTNRNGCGLKLVRNVPSNTITTINQCFSRFFGSDFYRNSNLFFGHYQIRIVFLPDFTELKRVQRMSHNNG